MDATWTRMLMFVDANEGDSSAARGKWELVDEAGRAVKARQALGDVDAQIRIAEHKVITIDSDIEVARRIGQRLPEKEAGRRELLRKIGELQAGRAAHAREGDKLGAEAAKLKKKAIALTEDALEDTRRRLVRRIVAVVREALDANAEIPDEVVRMHAAVVEGGNLILTRQPESVLDALPEDVWAALEGRLRRTA